MNAKVFPGNGSLPATSYSTTSKENRFVRASSFLRRAPIREAYRHEARARQPQTPHDLRRLLGSSLLPATLRMSKSPLKARWRTRMLSHSATCPHFSSGPLSKSHHFGCITFSDNLNLREARRDILPVALG
jgi:hypothetical protein